ncbi:MAG: hypothetical protein U0905_09365 [Pirellulales bacterium]
MHGMWNKYGMKRQTWLSSLMVVSLACVPARSQELPTQLSNVPPPLNSPSTLAPAPVSSAPAPVTTAGGLSGPNSNASVPSMETTPPANRSRSQVNNNYQLPKDAGQYWEEYDLRPYTQAARSSDHPEQAILDWILRDTGTDVWFTAPMGVLNADRNTLRVYHNDAMQKSVRQVYERFLNGSMDEQVFGVRIITINNPNWRTRAMGWMKSVQVQSPGVQAWLLPKENLAMLLALLRGRTDVREVQAVDLPIFNGQTQTLEQLRSRNYVREYQKVEQGWPPYLPVTSEIQEGFRFQISPLLSTDHRTVDVALKCNIDQVERLNGVNVDLPLMNGQTQSTQIQVPQVASWRLHERFRWPSDQVLLLSCGVVAAPTGSVNNTLLGQGANGLGLSKIIPPMAAGDRTDAIVILEFKGARSTHLSSPNANSAQSQSMTRGRY